jgi:hypothetical protein
MTADPEVEFGSGCCEAVSASTPYPSEILQNPAEPMIACCCELVFSSCLKALEKSLPIRHDMRRDYTASITVTCQYGVKQWARVDAR